MSKIKKQIESAIVTIKEAGLTAVIKKSTFTSKRGVTEETFSINISQGIRPVSVWPIQGTIFAGPKKRKTVDGGGWMFKKPITVRHLSFDGAIYMSVQIALTGV